MKAFVVLSSLFLLFVSQSTAEVFTDNFEIPHDYLNDGAAGTGWDGFVGLGAGETVDELNASIDRAGQLYIQSTGGTWDPPFATLGPFLYKVVEGDFIATVTVTEFAGCPPPHVYHNDCSIMARVADIGDAGADEDFVAMVYFPTWVGNMGRTIDDGVEAEFGQTYPADRCTDTGPYLQLERAGNTFHFKYSSNGTSWTELSGSPQERSDMDGLPLQVGLEQVTYDVTTGYAAFDDFTLTYGDVQYARSPNPSIGEDDASVNVQLSWTSGDYTQDVNGHRVFIGTNEQDVIDATLESHPNVDLYIESDPVCKVGQLETNQTYYWRVDEVNEPTVWEGDVWNFVTESGKAKEPDPYDGHDSVQPDLILSWTASGVAGSHDVYFGNDEAAVSNASRPAGDVDHDGDVDCNDIWLVAQQWLLDPPVDSLPSADLNGDDNVNFADWAIVANDWRDEADNVFKGNRQSATYCPGVLDVGVEYFWRIDEVNEGRIWKGDTWSFTTTTPPVNWVFIIIDPADRLMNAAVLGEWSTPGDLEDWTGEDVTGLSSESGYLTGIGSAASPRVQKTGFSGLDLDFGYFDYLQIRIKVPESFDDDIIIYFGTSTHSGFDYSGRVFTIPTSFIPKDGQWHTYRLDLGLVVWWRDSLTDLEIKPLGNSGSGQQFFIDYVEVGDLPDDVLLINWDLNVNTGEGETIDDCSYMESKHAVFWWSPQSYVRYASFNPAVMGRRALRMMEESYQVYCKKLPYDEPFESFDLWRRDGNRYKVNHVTWYDGFWAGGWNGFMHVGINGWGLLDEGSENPMPHEFGHCIQGHQLGYLTGGHWESHTNWLRQMRNYHYAELFTDLGFLEDKIFEASNFRQDHGKFIYADYRIHHALQDFGSELGLPDIVADIWKVPPKEQTVYEKIAAALSPSDDLGDVVANGMRHWPLLDFSYGDSLKYMLWNTSNDKAWYKYINGSHLIPCPDKPGWWRCPFERSPERFAYMSHVLEPNSTTVTVELQGFDLLGSTEDWRWSLLAVDGNDDVRYSDIFDNGQTGSMVLTPSEIKVYLVVVPTPTDTSLNLEWTDNRLPVDKCFDRLHYAYEVRIEGATPAVNQLGWTKGTGSYLPPSQGGGWKDSTATVNSTAYVGPNSMVLGNAKVYNYARIEDYAVIKGNATVQDYATVSGSSVVMDNAIVRNYAKVRDRAIVEDSAIVEENGVVEDYAHLRGSTRIQDFAIARGSCLPEGGTISNTAILDYDYSMTESLSDGVHFAHVPWGGWYIPYYVDTKAKPRGLAASYRIEEAEGDVCWDEFGAQHAVLRGSPQRVYDATMNSQVLRLDGSTQYVVLDRSLCDLSNGSFGLWVKPTDNTSSPLLFMGSSGTEYLHLALVGGYAEFTITSGGTTQGLISTSVIPTGSWTHIAVTLDGSQGALYVNGGAPEDTSAITLVPGDVLGSNDYTQAEALYVGRDYRLYAGDLEDIRFYNVALTQAEVDNEIRRAGDVIGVFYYNAPQIFDGSTTEAQSGVKNGLERVLEASIYPDTSDNVTYYEAVLDSTDERGGGFEGSGFGLDNGEILVRLENVGFWRTGVYVTLVQWQKITVAFDGSTAQLYVDDVPQGSTSYSATEADVAGKNYRIGFAMDTGSNKYYFDGQIKDVFIYDRVP